MPLVNGTGNRLITTDMVVEGALKILKNNLVFAPLVYRDLEKRFGSIGDRINIKLPPRVKSESGRVISNYEPLIDETAEVVIDNQEHIAFRVSQKDLSLSIDKFLKKYVESGVIQLANKIDKSIADALRLNGYYSSEATGGSIDQLAFLRAAAYQDMVGVPDDGKRYAILNPLDGADLANSLSSKYNPDFVNKTIMSRWIGTPGGYNAFKSQNVIDHTNGAADGLAVATAPSDGDSTISLTASTAGTLTKGTILTFSGVYEINPQNYTSTNRLMRFVVTADTSVGSTATAVPIAPAFNAGTVTTTDGDGSSISKAAYQNVSALPTTSSTVTIVGGAGNSYRQNLLFHKEAVALVMVSIEEPWHAVGSTVRHDPDTGLAISLTGSFDVVNHMDVTRLDVIWGVKVIRPELAHRLLVT